MNAQLKPSDAAEDLRQLIEFRAAYWAQHPVVIWGTHFVLPTPILKAIATIVADSIEGNRAGRGFWGLSRFGKSRAILYFCFRCSQTFPHVPVLKILASHGRRANESDFYGDMLKAAGYTLPKSRPPKERRDQVVDLLWTICNSRGQHKLVLFIDEAQEWGIDEWSWLKEIQILLELKNITLITIPFGQAQLRHVKTALKAAGRDDLVARFLRRLVPFRGIRSQEQLAQFFEVFDTACDESTFDWTFSQFFFPRGFDAGWRFASEANLAWRAFTATRPDPLDHEFGMEWIAFAVRHFLKEFSVQDEAAWQGTPEHWKRAVDACEIAEFDDEADAAAEKVPEEAASETPKPRARRRP